MAYSFIFRLYASQRDVETKVNKQNVCMFIFISAVSLHGQVLITCSVWAVLVNNDNMKSHNNKNTLISRLSNNHFYIACGRSRVRFSYQTPVIVTQLLWFSCCTERCWNSTSATIPCYLNSEVVKSSLNEL